MQVIKYFLINYFLDKVIDLAKIQINYNLLRMRNTCGIAIKVKFIKYFSYSSII